LVAILPEESKTMAKAVTIEPTASETAALLAEIKLSRPVSQVWTIWMEAKEWDRLAVEPAVRSIASRFFALA
jgi:hypothetical protein